MTTSTQSLPSAEDTLLEVFKDEFPLTKTDDPNYVDFVYDCIKERLPSIIETSIYRAMNEHTAIHLKALAERMKERKGATYDREEDELIEYVSLQSIQSVLEEYLKQI